MTASAPETLGTLFDAAVELAEDLAKQARSRGDATTARAAANAYDLARRIHTAGEALADFAGVMRETSSC